MTAYSHAAARRGLPWLLILIAVSAEASEGPPPVLNPKTYRSPSSEFALHVDPSTMYGQGEGTYRFTRNDGSVWSANHPFTLWEAVVTDEGVVAGYAYTCGWRGFWVEHRDREPGEFHVVIFNPDGTLRLNEVTKRTQAEAMHAPPNPTAEGLIVDPENDRLIARMHEWVRGQTRQTWRMYQLSTGASLARFEPAEGLRIDDGRVGRLTDVRLVPSTPLVLAYWALYPRNYSEYSEFDEVGALFALIDPEGTAVWQLALPGDHRRPRDDESRWQFWDKLRKPGAVLVSTEAQQFQVRVVSSDEIVAFRVEPGIASDSRWGVREIGRGDGSFEASEESKPDTLPTIELRHLGDIRLGESEAEPLAVRGVSDFDFDDRGRIGFLRPETKERSTFVIVSQTGEVLCEAPVDGIGTEVDIFPMVSWLGGERWLVHGNHYVGGTTQRIARTFRVELPNKVQVLEFLEPFAVTAVASMRNGWFVVRATQGHGKPTKHALIGYDDADQRRWTAGIDEASERAHTIAVTTEGEVVAVVQGENCLKFFDPDTQSFRGINCKQALGGGVWKIAADVRGGLVTEAWGKVKRLAADASVRAEFYPAYQDGRRFNPAGIVRAAPDGALWACDGESLVRLGADGRDGHVLGRRPEDDRPGRISALTIDSGGRFYAVSQRTWSVHVFDAEGCFIRSMAPWPHETTPDEQPTEISTAHDGGVFIAPRIWGPARLAFAPNGTSLGFIATGVEEICGKWLHKPASPEMWLGGCNQVYLIGEDGLVQLTIQRRPDGAFLDWVHAMACAADGSLAVAAGRPQGMVREVGHTINLYDPAGEPIRTFAVPNIEIGAQRMWVRSLAYSGTHVAVPCGEVIQILKADGTPLGAFTPVWPRQTRPHWTAFFPPDGKELWLWNHGDREIRRYALPQSLP